MENWKRINDVPHSITAMIVLCQDYVLADEEFMNNQKIKSSANNPEAWIEMAESLYSNVSVYLEKANGNREGYDDYDASNVTDSMILNYIMNPNNRFDMNDMICDAIENWIKYSKQRR
jgi:hypothetical protein